MFVLLSACPIHARVESSVLPPCSAHRQIPALFSLPRLSRRAHHELFTETIIPPRFPMVSLADFSPAGKLFDQFRQEVSGKTLIVEQNIFIEGTLLSGALTHSKNDIEKVIYRKVFSLEFCYRSMIYRHY